VAPESQAAGGGTARKPPRASERAYWNRATWRWERFEPQLMYALAGVDPALFRALDLRPGQRILDVGCGSGEPALTIAQMVAPRGSVLGIDLSPDMLAIARRRARDRGVGNARFRAGDVGRLRPTGPRFHGVVSRFGLMFVDDVPGALESIRRALRPGGRVAFAVWASLERNPLSQISAEASRPFLKEPPPDPERVPHPLRFGRAGVLARLTRMAGFERVTAVGVRAPHVFGSVEDFLSMNLDFPNPLRDLYLSLSRRDQHRFRDRLARATRRYQVGPVVRVPALAWVVAGRRPIS
jgi:enediyne biosynthesis protein CalE5